MENTIEISVIIPVYNSYTFLEGLVNDIANSFSISKRTFEIILVDDGSRDNSWDVIKGIRSKNSNVKGFRLSKNYGQHKAIFCGLHNCSGEIIVTMDDDFEHPVNEIEEIVKQLQNSKDDIIYALPDKSKKQSISRAVATKIYRSMSKMENPTGGDGSSFRFMKKELVKNLCTHSGHLFVLDELILWHTSYVGNVKINYGKSKKNNSGYNYFLHMSIL